MLPAQGPMKGVGHNFVNDVLPKYGGHLPHRTAFVKWGVTTGLCASPHPPGWAPRAKAWVW